MIRKSEKHTRTACIKAFLLLVSFPYFYPCFAQSPAAYNLSDLYNFNVKTIYYLHQAQNRKVWISTDQGLFAFDGTDFYKYSNNAYQSEYSAIREDQEGRIWCVNFAGQVFYTEGDSLKLFRDVSEYTGDGLVECSPVYFPDIYIGTDCGYIVADFYDKTSLEHVQTDAYAKTSYEILPRGDTIYIDLIRQLQAYKNGFIYIANKVTAAQLQKDSVRSLFSIKHAIKLPSLFSWSDRIMAVNIENDTTFEIYTHKNDTTTIKTFIGLPQPNTAALYYDEYTQQYWLGTNDGVLVFDRDLNHRLFLQGNSISDIIRDHEGNYWVATLYSGVYIIPSQDIVALNTHNSALLHSSIIDMEKTSNNTLFLIDHAGNLYRYSVTENGLFFLLNTGKEPKKMTYNSIKKMLHFHGSNILYDLKAEKLISSYYQNIKSGTAIDSVHFLISQSETAMITNFETSPAKPPMDTAWQQRYTLHNNSSIYPNKITLRYKRSQANTVCRTTGTLYVSYSDGLFFYKNAVEHRVLYKGKPLLISSLHPTTGKGVWAANMEGTLLYIDENEVTPIARFGATISQIRQKDSLLFLGTNNGLIRYNLNSRQQEVINTLDGLPSNTVTGLAIVNDTVYVATLKGLARVSVSYHYKNTIAPEVSLAQITVNGKPRAPKGVLKLKPNENSLAFTFTTYALRSQKTFTYAYRIVETGSEWTNTPLNTVSFTALGPGRYTFQLKAINEDGVESTQAREVRFVIDKPFYQQWWFYISTIASVAMLVAFGFSYRIKNIKRQNTLQQQQKNLEKKLAESTITTLKAQMNPHFTFNTMNAVQSLILKGNRDEAYHYLAKFSLLLRENLNVSEKNFIGFDKELEMITTYLELEKLRLRKDFEYHITGTETIGDIKIPAMIIQPFVENAIKHGLLHKEGKKKLTLNFQQSKLLQCTVTDNGIGRKAAEAIRKNRKDRHSSFSTGAMEKRFALLRAYYKLDLGFAYTDLEEKNVLTGTQVTLNIPYFTDDD